MKTIPATFRFIVAIALLVWAVGCASTRQAEQAEQTEQLLTEAGFKPLVASTEKQLTHLNTLTPDQFTVVKLKGKTFYMFPDPKRNLLFVGNPENYQSYQQILEYKKLAGQNYDMSALGEDTGGDDKWVEWTNNTGWTYGSD